jgi:hypothetical protein
MHAGFNPSKGIVGSTVFHKVTVCAFNSAANRVAE